MIEGLREEMSMALVANKFLPIPLKFHFTLKKKTLLSDLWWPDFTNHSNLFESNYISLARAVTGSIFLSNLLNLELSQYIQGGSTFSSSGVVAASRDCSKLGHILCLCLPVLPAPAVCAQKAQLLALQSTWKYLIVFWNSFSERLQDNLQRD